MTSRSAGEKEALRRTRRSAEQMSEVMGRVNSVVLETCKRFGVKPPTIRWSTRLTATAGKASKQEVVFSLPLLFFASDAFCIETAVHEAAHFIDFQVRGHSDHGAPWRTLMAELGYPEARRCHALDRSVLYRYEIRCGECDEPLRRYTRRPTRTMRTKRSRCCYAKLQLHRVVAK